MTRRRRRRWPLIPRLALAALALSAPASASGGVHLGLDASGYPQLQATVVTAAPTAQAPALSENGAAVAGLQEQNLGRGKAIVLAIDRSRSMIGTPLRDATAAAEQFVGLRQPGDRLGVVAFGRKAVVLAGFDGTAADAAGALGALTVDSRSGTALYDAVVLAARRLAAQPLPGRVLVLLTDGHDVSSAATIADAVSAARRAHVLVYPIAVAGAGFDPTSLRELAQATGGTYHSVGATSLLGGVYAAIADELSRTWHLSWTTAARPGDAVRVAVDVPAAGRAAAVLRLPPGPGGTETTPPPSRLLPAPLYGTVGTALAALIVAAALAAALLLLVGGRGGDRLRARLEAHVAPVRNSSRRRRRGNRSAGARQLFRLTEHAFGKLNRFRSLQRLLERADLPLRAAEFVYVQLGAGFLVALVFAVAAAPPLFILVGLVGGAAIPHAFVSLRARARLRAFENQLPDLLITIAASLKAGHSFRQGLQTVVDEGHPPASEELRRVLAETSLGRPMDDALRDMALRVGSKNLEFVITAVTIQRQVGGSLAGLFDMVADAVRQRQAFARKVKGLTAMGRMSAYVLIGLPFFLAAVLTAMNPTYMTPLYHTHVGHELVVTALVMMALGSAVLRKMISFKG